jgi:Flp pilus assembly protein TadG
MKHLLSLHKPKSKAQAMVEFALVLPILLLLIYGLIEVGRLIFIYSSVVSSARQAARYGAATGLNNAGTSPRYQDCAGIRNAAQGVAFINAIADADIAIDYDVGEGNGPKSDYANINDFCAPGSTIGSGLTAEMVKSNSVRIRVEVRSQFTPIVPIVPLDPLEIRSVSARTILAHVKIFVTPAGGSGGGGGGGATPPTDTPTNTPTATATFTPPAITFTPSLTPTRTPSPTPINTAVTCDLRHSELKTSPFGMTIYNNASFDVNVFSIKIYWRQNSPAGQKLNIIKLGGVNIWSSESTTTPLTVTSFIGNVTIPAGNNKLLQVTFNKNYKSFTAAPYEYIQVIFVENGCPMVDSADPNQLP